VNGQDSKAVIFDVFLCHNSEDKPAVREIAQKLAEKGIKPWLDEADIRGGDFWHTAIGQQLETVKAATVFVGQHGLGPWQIREIIALLDQFDRRGCRIIPAILESAPAEPVLPWSLVGHHYVDFRATHLNPLARLAWAITEKKPSELSHVSDSEKPATMQEAIKGHLLPSPGDRAPAISQARFYPALAEPPPREQATQLEILRRKVLKYWVEEVLEHSLHHDVLISLGKRSMDRAVDAPWNYTVEVAGAVDSAALDDREVSAIYDATGLLLILGEPGSGKTTTLLDLARTLLERAGKDLKERVPVVLNLSSWKNQPLLEWMSSELLEKYRVPRKIARSWLQNNYLLPLLDGLDEVDTILQPDCVSAINVFIEDFNPSGLVVCCRLLEYRWLPERLKLDGAICLEPLSPEEVSKYLDRGGPKLAVLREAVNTDSVLQELAQTPLMLSIMSLAFQGGGTNELTSHKGVSLEEHRKLIFNLYVDKMFGRKGRASLAFPKEKTIGWLSWFARRMRERSQSIFLVEGLQPSWLGTKARRVIFETAATLSLGIVPALIFALIFALMHSFTYGLVYGLSFGLGGGWTGGMLGGLGAGSVNRIALVETTSWDWNQFWRGMIRGSISGLFAGLILGLILVLILVLIHGAIFGGLLLALPLIFGLPSGLIYGLLNGLVCGFTDKVKADKSFPNQGIKLSRKNSLAAFFVSSLAAGLLFGLLVGLLFGLIGGLSIGLSVGPIAGLIVGLHRGGSAVIKHYVLRLILWRNGDTPLNFIKFLDHCDKLILLKKVGGGYIFIHRMLLEYFAELTPETLNAGDTTTGSK
jgi:hypothetical protein